MKLKLLIGVVLAGVVAAGVIYLSSSRSSAKANNAGPTTARVERGPFRLVVSSTGKIVSNLDVEIKCKASGEIMKLPFDVSDTVKKGELLLELDPIDEQRIVKQAQANQSASQSRLAVAKQNLIIAERTLETDGQKAAAALKSVQARAADLRRKANRIKELLNQKPTALASPEEYETAETAALQAAADEDTARVRVAELDTQKLALELSRQQVRLAEAQAESDGVDLELAQQRLTDTKVVAPIDGVVTLRPAQIGQIMSSGISNVGGGTTAMTLSDLSRVFALAAVDESDIGRVKVGQPAFISVDAFPGRRFPGKVVRIATRGVNVSNVVTFEVKVEVLSRENQLLKPEMTATVDITAAEKENALTVPSQALVRKGRRPVATVVKGAAQEERPVEIGLTDGVRTEVVSGLDEGDAVIVHNTEADSRWRGGQRPMTPGFMGGPPRGR